MQDLPFLAAIAGFTVIGIGTIAKPALVTALSGIFDPTLAGSNEDRGVRRTTWQQFNPPRGNP